MPPNCMPMLEPDSQEHVSPLYHQPQCDVWSSWTWKGGRTFTYILDVYDCLALEYWLTTFLFYPAIYLISCHRGLIRWWTLQSWALWSNHQQWSWQQYQQLYWQWWCQQWWQYKVKWVEGDKTDRRVGLAVQALVDAGHGNRHNLKKTVKKWLQRRSTTSSKYGPNHKPTLRTVIAFYEAERIAREVKEEMKSSWAFDQRKCIGIYTRVVTRVMQEVLCDKECLWEMEDQQVRWSRRGPPW